MTSSDTFVKLSPDTFNPPPIFSFVGFQERKVAPDVMMFGSVAKGYKAGGVNLTMLANLRDRLEAINREEGATFVVIEHNMEFVMSLCSRVVVMAEGKVLAIGTPAEIRANTAVIDAYLGH